MVVRLAADRWLTHGFQFPSLESFRFKRKRIQRFADNLCILAVWRTGEGWRCDARRHRRCVLQPCVGGFELCKDLLDRIEVGAIGRQEDEPGARSSDRPR